MHMMGAWNATSHMLKEKEAAGSKTAKNWREGNALDAGVDSM